MYQNVHVCSWSAVFFWRLPLELEENRTKYLNRNFMFHLFFAGGRITQKDPNVCIIILKTNFRWGSIFPWEDMEVKLHFETQKRNRIVKFYCAFDAVQCWCALFPPPLPAASGTISPSLCLPPPLGLGLAQTPPGNIKVHSQALIEETLWVNGRKFPSLKNK